MEDSMQGAVAASSATALSSARTWRRPQLSLLGEVGSLTESGSMTNQEGFLGMSSWRPGCRVNINNTGSMC